MAHRNRLLILAIASLVVLTPVLAACGASPAPTSMPTQGSTQAPATPVPPTATKAPPTETVVPPTATPKAPAVGGKLVWAVTTEYATLDPHLCMWGETQRIALFIGATLIARSPENKYTPYLADNWKISDDGINWTFKLRTDVKFHDGTPLTAQDYAWTFQRALDPATKTAISIPSYLKSAQALDDYTLQLTLKMAYFPLMDMLTTAGTQPLPRAAVEKLGAGFGRQPVGVGPYVFKEWQTGVKIVLERNPDFRWGPGWAKNQGPAYIQTIEQRFISESATIMAGLETGEISFAEIDPKDQQRIKDTGKFQIQSAQYAGMYPGVVFNTAKPPFDDVRVRQAFNLAVNRQKLVEIVLKGYGTPQTSPLSPTVAGYWTGVEKLGYGFDLPKAKALLAEAGYKDSNGDGILDKDGQPFKLALKTFTTFQTTAEVLQQQYKDLGVQIDLNLEELGVMLPKIRSGDFTLGIAGKQGTDADLLYLILHSSQAGLGGLNFSQVKDPALDKLLELTRTATDPTKRQQAVQDAVIYAIDKAYYCPLYVRTRFWAVANEIKGAYVDPTAYIYLENAYWQAK